MCPNIEKLENQLTAKEKICTTAEALHTFPPSFFKPFYTSDIGIIVCQKGKFTFTVGKKKFQVNPNETVFLPNDNAFQVVSHSDDLEVYLLLYRVEPIRDNLGTKVTTLNIYTKIYPNSYYAYHTGKEQDLIHYISLLHSAQQDMDNSFKVYELKLLLISVTYHLCAIFHQKMMSTNALNARRTDVFLQLIQSIEEYYKRERGVEFYANRLCLSPKYLSGLSKSVCGYTVQELVFKAIIRESKTLLNTTSRTIQEISNEFNFPNASSFGTFFKKQTGMSPQKYRDSEIESRKGI